MIDAGDFHGMDDVVHKVGDGDRILGLDLLRPFPKRLVELCVFGNEKPILTYYN
jgi:hypothetical protein